MKEVLMTLTEYIALGGKIENITKAQNKYHNKAAKSVKLAQTNPPSFGNPNGVNMYHVDNNLLAEMWIDVYANMQLI